MKRINSLVLFLQAIVVMTTACSDDKESSAGITNQSWTEGEILEISTEKDVTVRFTTYGKWVASITTNGATWCKLSQNSGNKGSHSFIVSVNSKTTTERTATITVSADGRSSSFQVRQKPSGTAEDAIVNQEVDEYLNEMYLWNDEYKTLTKNFNQGYEEFFYDNLYSMKTNTLDKKLYNGEYYLFSYIQKLPNINKTRAAIEKELEYSFGITGITPVYIGTSAQNYTIYFCIQGVYPNSPASEAGLKRGAMIKLINGNKINDRNIDEYYYNIQLPDAAISYTLTEDIMEDGGITGQKTYPLTAKAMYTNPVIFSKVNEEYEGHRIGYLVYSGFEASFDEELFNVFKEFKAKNVTDLILDLRYNGGGHVVSANLIASCVAGSSCSEQVFAKYRYSKERMNKIGNTKPEEKFSYDKYANLGTSLAAGDLSLRRLYCLVGNGTASASELVINSLKGIGIPVILIGETTTGKNVGMEVVDIEIDNDTYRVAPITFQSYNARDEGDYENGFTPDVQMDETNPYNEQGIFYTLKEYGTDKEPLYAKAIELITGKNPTPITRSATNVLSGKARKLPALPRPGHYGMLKPAQTAE